MKKFLLLCILLISVSCQNNGEQEAQHARIDSLESEIAAIKRANDTLSEHLLAKSIVTTEYPNYFDTIPEPEQYILTDLQKNQELIPKDAVLGGTMRFTAVKFINGEILVAEFEDGHIMGKAVYTYKMTKNGDLTYTYVGNIEY